MTEPVAPIDWARHYAAQREQQPVRKLLDQMSDHELVQLYERAEKAERAANLLADSHRRAEQAEAANTRARVLLEPAARAELSHGYDNSERAVRGYAREVLAALDEPEEPRPTVAPVHQGGNAEECPACARYVHNIAYPFLCPGPETQ